MNTRNQAWKADCHESCRLIRFLPDDKWVRLINWFSVSFPEDTDYLWLMGEQRFSDSMTERYTHTYCYSAYPNWKCGRAFYFLYHLQSWEDTVWSKSLYLNIQSKWDRTTAGNRYNALLYLQLLLYMFVPSGLIQFIMGIIQYFYSGLNMPFCQYTLLGSC